jgi:hypothetical protein
MRVMAQDYISRRNASIDGEKAIQYHGKLMSLAAGKPLDGQ